MYTTNEHGDVTHHTDTAERVHADDRQCGLCYLPGGESDAFHLALAVPEGIPILVPGLEEVERWAHRYMYRDRAMD